MDSSQFQEKLLSIQDRLLGFAYSLTANREEAHDLLQETSLKALKNKDKFVDNVNFRGWMFTIMRNIFINNYRKISNRNTIIDTTEDLYHLNSSQTSSVESPEGIYELGEINRVIDKFSDDYKVPFRMHVDGFKYREIAEEMNLPIGTVKSRIFFARKKLVDQLKDYSN